MSRCPNCGAAESETLPVWKDAEQRESNSQPTFIGCTSCHKLMRTRYLRDQDDETPPQAALTQRERDWLAARNMVGNQHTPRLSIVEYRVIKGAAVYFGVSDWRSKVDSTLTAEENVSVMEAHGTDNNVSTLRELRSSVE